MRTRIYFLTLLITVLAVCLTACNDSATQKASDAPAAQQPSPGGNNSASPPPQPAPTGANRNEAGRGEGAGGGEGTPATLAGTYTISEVENQGVVSMVDQNKAKTVITFKPAGTYRRESSREGIPYHIDTGTFRIEPPDRLVLRIIRVNRMVQAQPKEVHHTFRVSPDGEELKMISKDGKVATFRRSRDEAGN
jgi:hypothetical protein